MNPTPPAVACPVCLRNVWRFFIQDVDRNLGMPGVFHLWRCADCGLLTYTPRLSAEELRASYPAEYYAHAAAQPPAGLRLLLDDLLLGPNPKLLHRLFFAPALYYKRICGYAHYLRGIPPGRLLDVGCGDGAFLLKARQLGFDCHGLEPGGVVGPALRHHGIEFHDGALETLPESIGQFDLIVLNHVFEHLPDPQSALSHLRRLLLPHGRLLIRMPRTRQFQIKYWPANWSHMDLPRHIYLYDEQNFTLLARHSGLDVKGICYETLPLHLQWSLKRWLTGRRYAEPHWFDSAALTWCLLPFCSLLNRLRKGDCMAIWLTRSRTSKFSSQNSESGVW